MNELCLVMIFILVGFGIIGFKVGLLKMVFSLVSTIASLLIAVLFSPNVASMLEQNETIQLFLSAKVESVVDSFAIESLDEVNYINSLPFPEMIKEVLQEDNQVTTYISMQVENFEDYVCKKIVSLIINAIAFGITFLIAVIGVSITCWVLDIISRLPLLHQVNQLAGLCVGLAEGVLLIWIFFIFLTMFAGTEFGTNLMQMISESVWLSFLYDNNLIARFIM